MLSQGMLEVYKDVWAETKRCVPEVSTDDDFYVDEDLIFHEGRLMSKAEYEALR